uniref:Uncharacterized protein n=1 Tax=Arundo donax TaxID=35708 RepID=A0A0A9DD12_ARUDO
MVSAVFHSTMLLTTIASQVLYNFIQSWFHRQLWMLVIIFHFF